MSNWQKGIEKQWMGPHRKQKVWTKKKKERELATVPQNSCFYGWEDSRSESYNLVLLHPKNTLECFVLFASSVPLFLPLITEFKVTGIFIKTWVCTHGRISQNDRFHLYPGDIKGQKKKPLWKYFFPGMKAYTFNPMIRKYMQHTRDQPGLHGKTLSPREKRMEGNQSVISLFPFA